MNSLYLKIDVLIKAGSFKAASRLLKDRKPTSGLPVLQIAELFRRLGDYPSALTALRPELFEQNELKKKLSDALIFEYSLNLVQHGLFKQGQRLMDQVLSRPYAWHQLSGFIALKELDYAKAVLAFEQAQESEEASDYQKSLAGVNIANALLGTFQYQASIECADRTLITLNPAQHSFLVLYLAHIKAQAYAFLQNQNAFAEHSSMVFQDLVTPKENEPIASDVFEFHRGRFVAECVLGIPHLTAVTQLEAWANYLHDYHALNEIRVMDREKDSLPEALKANLLNVSGQFLKRRLEFLRRREITEPSELVIADKQFLKTESRTHKAIYQFRADTPGKFIKHGQIPHRILKLFLKNPSRRFAVVEIYREVYSDNRYFHPSQSPNLIHQAVRRLNQLLRLEKYPFQISSQSDRYALVPTQKFEVILENASFERPAFIEICLHLFSLNPFRMIELSQKLGLTSRQIQNQVRLHEKHFSVERRGRNLFYRVRQKNEP